MKHETFPCIYTEGFFVSCRVPCQEGYLSFCSRQDTEFQNSINSKNWMEPLGPCWYNIPGFTLKIGHVSDLLSILKFQDAYRSSVIVAFNISHLLNSGILPWLCDALKGVVLSSWAWFWDWPNMPASWKNQICLRILKRTLLLTTVYYLFPCGLLWVWHQFERRVRLDIPILWNRTFCLHHRFTLQCSFLLLCLFDAPLFAAWLFRG